MNQDLISGQFTCRLYPLLLDIWSLDSANTSPALPGPDPPLFYVALTLITSCPYAFPDLELMPFFAFCIQVLLPFLDPQIKCHLLSGVSFSTEPTDMTIQFFWTPKNSPPFWTINLRTSSWAVRHGYLSCCIFTVTTTILGRQMLPPLTFIIKPNAVHTAGTPHFWTDIWIWKQSACPN